MRIQTTLKTAPHQNPKSKKDFVPWADGSRGKKTAKSKAKPKAAKLDRVDSTLIGLGAGGGLSIAGSAYPSTWLHEMGHAQMIELMYDGGNPKIEVFPFKGGVTRWQLAPLSEVGEKFGADGARAMVSAAGTFVDMGVAATSFGVGFKMRKEHPIIGTALMGFGGATVLNSIAYAASAIGKDVVKLGKEGHDFANLAVKAGLPPIASVAILAAMLPLEYALLSYLEKKAEPQPQMA